MQSHRIDPWVLSVWSGGGRARRRPLVFIHSVHKLAVIPSENHYANYTEPMGGSIYALEFVWCVTSGDVLMMRVCVSVVISECPNDVQRPVLQ